MTRGPEPAASKSDRRQLLEAIHRMRERIDALDVQLVEILSERAACAVDIGRLKNRLGLSVYQPEREAEVLRHVQALNRGPLSGTAMIRLFERIIDEARTLERGDLTDG